jgi:hypothetical protein
LHDWPLGGETSWAVRADLRISYMRAMRLGAIEGARVIRRTLALLEETSSMRTVRP